jgi:hypothetical protein
MRAAICLLLLSACHAPSTVTANEVDESGWRPKALESSNADRPIVLRPPTREEAEGIASGCGVKVAYWNGLGRPSPESVYQPIHATPAERQCYFSRIRELLTTSPSSKVE